MNKEIYAAINELNGLTDEEEITLMRANNPQWRTVEFEVILSAEEKRKQGERMADLICQLIKEMGGLPSTAHGVAAALCKALEDRKAKP